MKNICLLIVGVLALMLLTGCSAPGPGTDGVVFALAVDKSGNVYAGGQFETAGGVTVNNIAKWDGTAWSALGTGDTSVPFFQALALDKTGNLYAGGINTVAKWDGTAWSALATLQENRSFQALAVDGSGNLYAGGDFIFVGGVTANGIAKWDGTAWSALGSGTLGNEVASVEALAVDKSGNVYAGGRFETLGGVTVNNIAKWDGTAWSALGSGTLGSGMYGEVNALALDASGNLYAGGSFTMAGGVAVNNIAKWDGTAWSTLGSGIHLGALALALDKSGNLYAGTSFQDQLTGILGMFRLNGAVIPLFNILSILPRNSIFNKWDGTSWSALGAGLSSFGGIYTPFFSIANFGVTISVHALALDSSGNLYVGGQFETAGGMPASNIAKWNGTSWSTLGKK